MLLGAESALGLLREGLQLAAGLNDRPMLVDIIETLGAAAGRAGDALTGSRLLRIAPAAPITRMPSGRDSYTVDPAPGFPTYSC